MFSNFILAIIYLPNQEAGAIVPVGRHVPKGRLFTLWEIMRIFRAGDVQDALLELMEIISSCEWADEHYDGEEIKQPFRKRALDAVSTVEKLASDNGSQFAHTFEITQRAYNELFNELKCNKYPAVRSEVKHVLDAITYDLNEHAFISVDSNLRHIIDSPDWMGKEILKAFPSTGADITEAGNCIAAGCHTAAVFHLMRVVEWGLRALCDHLHITRTRKSKKPKHKKYIPIAYSQWEKMLDAVHVKVDAKINKMAPGKRKQEAQEFYYPLLQDLKAFKDAWRNHVMHARNEYSAAQARAISEHVRRFLARLAMKVSETKEADWLQELTSE